MQTTFYFSNQRVKLSGFHLEFSRYGRDRMIGNTGRLRKKDEADESEEETDFEKLTLTPEEIREKSMARAKKVISDLILCNAWQWHKRNGDPYMPIFITFTFGENIVDLDVAHKEFKNFIKRLSYEHWGGNVNVLKYLAVIEFQERGAIHYHVVFFNLPFMDKIYDKIFAIWGQGFTWVESVKSEQGLIKYLSKYLTKSVDDGRLLARKSYFASKGLKKPLVHSFDEVVNIIRAITPIEAKTHDYEYEHEYLKTVVVDCYNLKNYPELMEEIKTDILEKYAL